MDTAYSIDEMLEGIKAKVEQQAEDELFDWAANGSASEYEVEQKFQKQNFVQGMKYLAIAHLSGYFKDLESQLTIDKGQHSPSWKIASVPLEHVPEKKKFMQLHYGNVVNHMLANEKWSEAAEVLAYLKKEGIDSIVQDAYGSLGKPVEKEEGKYWSEYDI